MKTLLAFAILLAGFTFAFAQNEQAPIQEKEFKYKDWTYQSVRDDQSINLREFANDKKLVLVVYFAPWCHNWRYESRFVETLYEKYKDQGLGVIGVGEYDTVEAMKTDLDTKKITFPVVYESDSKTAKKETLHYDYRKQVGDTRNWGSPFNIFFDPANSMKKGDVLLKKAYVVSGELIEKDAEKFVREKLGLPAEEKKIEEKSETANKTVEACEEETTTEFKKPV